ncbi:MAG: gamma-glutamyl-gamma-aminobutyrate hydrolase family protein [Nanoarchaeota archaeon]|nr:gamma-glutamyl-gamma-aminobutyrate hydrolase family protein [Nanoarchaeota archaeon]
MNLVYIDHHDSFAGTIAAYFSMAMTKIHEQDKSENDSKVIVLKSDCDLERVVEHNPSLILLGPGPNSPTQAGNYLEAIDRFHKDYPLFGICLGFQALMHYFGQPVEVLPEPIHGACSKIINNGQSIFEGISDSVEMARYNSLGVTKTPSGFIRLAYSRGENGLEVVMAAQHEILPIAGVQFHPESVISATDNAGMRLVENAIRQLARKHDFE